MSNKVKIIGYAQKVFYNDGIEYRNFSNDLVGNQLTENSNGESSVLTFGNFVTTTNYSSRASRIFVTKKFSNFYSLDDYNLTVSENKKLIDNNVNVVLNLDNSNLSNYAYFGSTMEFIRVSLETIINNWPASLYLTPLRNDGVNTIVGNTVSNYVYDPITNVATFNVDTNFISNKYNINFLTNGTTINSFNQENQLRNMSVSFRDYVILINDSEYKVIDFIPANNTTNSTIGLTVEGDPFGFNGDVNSKPTYHIKPNKLIVEKFFNSLDSFENNLLNRLTLPKYTSSYKYKEEQDDGTITLGEETLTWPVTDGYNIDYDTTDYVRFVNRLAEISKAKDETESNLITRFLTAQAISDFDTLPTYDGNEEETAGQKMNKTLKIYGREFDEIKKYIEGISFANVVTYDKKENTPDQLVKYLARVLGWELTSSIIENDIINSYLNVGARSYAGQSRGLTPAEAEVELWRRLILNSSWIWKSKGTRKAIEFFFKLIGTPDGLIEFNEHVYVAKKPIDMDLFYATLENNELENDLSLYNVDDEGYPKFFRDTSNMYFQKGGQWYRETAGPAASQYILAGNNPHVGPYDRGKAYINQLENIIPDFTAFTLTSTTITTGTTQLFTNYNSGIINQYTGDTFISLQNDNGINLSGKVSVTTSIIQDPFPQIEYTDCGCDVPEDDEALKLYVKKESNAELTATEECLNEMVSGSWSGLNENRYHTWKIKLYRPNGTLSPNTKLVKYISPTCCSDQVNGLSYYHEEYENIGTGTTIEWKLINCGYLCANSENKPARNLFKAGLGSYLSCQWVLSGPSLGNLYNKGNNYYLKFVDPKGNERVVNEADSGFCPINYTTHELITDPYTNKEGFACKLNQDGINLLSNDPSENNYLYQLYLQRAINKIGCFSDTII
jgi:hypothetical protein